MPKVMVQTFHHAVRPGLGSDPCAGSRRHNGLCTSTARRMLGLAASAFVVWSAAGIASAGSTEGSVPGQLVQLLDGWPSGAPTAFGADQAGPFWARRSGTSLLLERLVEGRIVELRQVSAPGGHPPEAFRPRLVRGDGSPELLYRNGRRLQVTGEVPLGDALQAADWEAYSAWSSGSHLFASAFGIGETGVSFVALVPGSQSPTVAALRPAPQGVWEPKALLSPTQAHVVYRASLLAPRRGFGLIVETMDRGELLSSGRWSPTARRQYQLGATEPHLGEPSASLDEAGAVHWASAAWNGSQMTGAIHVDGTELELRGKSGSVYWLPSLAWVAGRGLALAVIGPEGEAHVGLVQGEQLLTLAELASVPPGFSQAPPLFLASSGARLYIATGHGLWSFDAQDPVPAPLFSALVAQLAAGLFLWIGLRRLRPRWSVKS